MIANAPNNFYASIAPIRMMHLKSIGESLEDLWKPLWNLPDHEGRNERCLLILSSLPEQPLVPIEVFLKISKRTYPNKRT